MQCVPCDHSVPVSCLACAAGGRCGNHEQRRRRGIIALPAPPPPSCGVAFSPCAVCLLYACCTVYSILPVYSIQHTTCILQKGRAWRDRERKKISVSLSGQSARCIPLCICAQCSPLPCTLWEAYSIDRRLGRLMWVGCLALPFWRDFRRQMRCVLSGVALLFSFLNLLSFV